jgi:hypothetical protein
MASGDKPVAEGLLAWIGGQPNVAAAAKRTANLKGDVDHFGALSFLQGLLVVLRDSGFSGLLLVLDEVETLQRVRGDVREKGLNALRQLMDEIDAGRFPGLYLLVTGTPAFFDGPQGVQRLAPLAQRLHVDFSTDARFDNPRAVQVRLANFDFDRLCEVGRKVRDIYATTTENADRVRRLAGDAYIADLARAVAGGLGGKVGIAPRVLAQGDDMLVGAVDAAAIDDLKFSSCLPARVACAVALRTAVNADEARRCATEALRVVALADTTPPTTG